MQNKGIKVHSVSRKTCDCFLSVCNVLYISRGKERRAGANIMTFASRTKTRVFPARSRLRTVETGSELTFAYPIASTNFPPLGLWGGPENV